MQHVLALLAHVVVRLPRPTARALYLLIVRENSRGTVLHATHAGLAALAALSQGLARDRKRSREDLRLLYSLGLVDVARAHATADSMGFLIRARPVTEPRLYEAMRVLAEIDRSDRAGRAALITRLESRHDAWPAPPPEWGGAVRRLPAPVLENGRSPGPGASDSPGSSNPSRSIEPDPVTWPTGSGATKDATNPGALHSVLFRGAGRGASVSALTYAGGRELSPDVEPDVLKFLQESQRTGTPLVEPVVRPRPTRPFGPVTEWEAWSGVRKVLDRMFGSDSVQLDLQGHVDTERSHPDAVRMLTLLRRTNRADRSMHRHAPEFVLRAWETWSRLFNLPVQDDTVVRMLLRRLNPRTSPVLRLDDLAPRLAGFVMLRQKARRAVEMGLPHFKPKSDPRDVFGAYGNKFLEQWQDAIRADKTLPGPWEYLDSIRKPYVDVLDEEGRPVDPEAEAKALIPPQQRLDALMARYAEGEAFQREMHENLNGKGSWDKLPRETRLYRVLAEKDYDELVELEEELSDPAARAFPEA